MFKSESQRIVRRIMILVVLLVCLGATANTRTTEVAAAACPWQQEMDCYNNGGMYFNPFHCTCSYYEDVYACEQAGGTWDFHIAQCRF